jgi:hypothetical protein
LFEELFSRSGVNRLQRIEFIRFVIIERDKVGAATTALDCLLLLPFVGEKMLQRGKKKCSETPAFAIGEFERVAFKKSDEEFLGEIARLVRVASETADVPEERRPVRAAESLEGLGCFARFRASGGEDNTPVRSGEPFFPLRDAVVAGVGRAHGSIMPEQEKMSSADIPAGAFGKGSKALCSPSQYRERWLGCCVQTRGQDRSW